MLLWMCRAEEMTEVGGTEKFKSELAGSECGEDLKLA
jgi:hypothetical protein